MPRLISLLVILIALAAPLAAWQVSHDSDGEWGEMLKDLVRSADPDSGIFLWALGVAFFAGAAHALTPGHGKALVAAYLVGSKGTVWDAVFLGSVVTVTHTAAVFVLGLLTLYASQYFLMEQLYAGLSVISGMLIVGIGSWLLSSRWKFFRHPELAEAAAHSHSHGPFGHTHSHVHPHTHDHSLEHSHEDGHPHDHDHAHSHDHDHAHSHDHDHDHAHSHDHGHEGGAGNAHDHEHDHSHSPGEGRGSLLSLGISGGLIPCPEALAVLLISFTLNRIMFGLIILLAFSLGLAAILIAIGVAMVMAGPTFKRFAKDGPLMRFLPVGSAVVVTLLGVAILAKAATDAGWLGI